MVGHTFVTTRRSWRSVRLVAGELGTVQYIDSQRVNLGLHQFDPTCSGTSDRTTSDRPLLAHRGAGVVQCTGGCHPTGIEDVPHDGLPVGRARARAPRGSCRRAPHDDGHRAEDTCTTIVQAQGSLRPRSGRLPDERAARTRGRHPQPARDRALQIEVRHFITASAPAPCRGATASGAVRRPGARRQRAAGGGTRVAYRSPAVA